MARLLGYRWPAELEGPHPSPLPEGEGTEAMRLSQRARELVHRCDELLQFADDDGIVCIPAVRAESPAAERLLEILQAAYGPKWSNSLLHDLLTEAGCKPGTTLDDWLRNAFFEQHCKLFHNRPFIWHIWDGRKDGFSCLVNYHKLNYKTLENLTYSYLGDWIKKQSGRGKGGQGRCRSAAGRRPGVAGETQADPGRGAALRHLRPLEAAPRAAHRLEPRPERRRANEHPPVRRSGHPAKEPEHQVDEGSRQRAGARQGRIPLVLEGQGIRR